MVSNIVLDASALLALLNAEEGADLVQESLPNALISSVNFSEVVTRLSLLEMPEEEIREALQVLGLKVVPFDEAQAFQAGYLSRQTQGTGLSLGDRACLALAATVGGTALTADQAWRDLQIGVEIVLIRGGKNTA